VALSIFAGVAAGALPAVGGWYVAKWINRRVNIPMRETPGISMSELKNIVNKPESELPGFFFSIAPVVVPIFLISIASFFDVARRSVPDAGWAVSFVNLFGGEQSFKALFQYVEFIGNKNVALLVGAILSMWLLVRQKGITVSRVCELVGPPLETAGVIILITSAGGAFGLMLRNAGVGDAIKAAAAGYDVNLVVLSYMVALVIRIAQGSATVAMLTT
jgi:GntP family gluconate:H+ symporter